MDIVQLGERKPSSYVSSTPEEAVIFQKYDAARLLLEHGAAPATS
jgi:hypothetical protein